jgi:RNA-directed DNA polymerase
MDIKDFFPSVSGARIQAAFRTIGYPEAVADLLGGICTNITPGSIWQESAEREVPSASHVRMLYDLRTLYGRPHLPQGAPTSPSLANFCAYRLDARLSGLAEWAGGAYTRYGDDLAFSGGREVARSAEQYAAQIGAIVLEEGWSVNHRKTRVMPQSVRQHLAGLVTNEGLNVSRKSYDELKAILTNCVRHGPESQNREAHPAFRAHLEGRVAFVASVNVEKGARLRAIFERIAWE